MYIISNFTLQYCIGFVIQQQNTLYSKVHMEYSPFIRIDRILVHKQRFSKRRKIETISSIFSDDNVIML